MKAYILTEQGTKRIIAVYITNDDVVLDDRTFDMCNEAGIVITSKPSFYVASKQALEEALIAECDPGLSDTDDCKIWGADTLSKEGLVEAAKNAVELGDTCDED